MAQQFRQRMTLPQVIEALITLSNRVKKLEAVQDNTSGWAGMQENITETRAFDADATTVDELADVLGTLINDQVNMRLIK